MARQSREKVTTRVNSEILSAVRDLARSEGRQLEALVDEALADLIEKHKDARPRENVIATYQTSHETFAPLYRRLAE